MTELGWRMLRAGGWGRPTLLAACTAVVSGLLLVAIALLHLPDDPRERLFSLVADPGTRGGTAFGAVLLCLPPLLLLHQVVRLGTAARERRLAALRLAGATSGEVRRLGATEVGLPVAAGGVLGIGVYAVLRLVAGGGAYVSPESQGWVAEGGGWSCTGDCGDFDPSGGGGAVQLVPTSVAPAWWEIALVVLGVTVAGVAVGMLASRRVVVSPLGVARRVTTRPPRPWGLLLVGGGLALGGPVLTAYDSVDSQAIGIGVVALVVLGIVSLAPWVAYVVGRTAARRTSSAPVLLASRRLVAEPRPAGRAAAAVGGIALVAGACGSIVGSLIRDDQAEFFYLASVALVAVALLGALVAVIGSLAVHSVETLLDGRRSMAALVALGAPEDVIEDSQRWEAALVALPMTAVGVLLGSVGTGAVDGGPDLVWVGSFLVSAALTGALVWLAILIAVRLTRPWARLATSPTNLRTE